jgi:hypothetical protein
LGWGTKLELTTRLFFFSAETVTSMLSINVIDTRLLRVKFNIELKNQSLTILIHCVVNIAEKSHMDTFISLDGHIFVSPETIFFHFVNANRVPLIVLPDTATRGMKIVPPPALLFVRKEGETYGQMKWTSGRAQCGRK